MIAAVDCVRRLWFASPHRNRTRQHDYDIVIGSTLNDDTRALIHAVMNAVNGAIPSDTARNLLIEMLEPDNLPEK